MTVEKTENQKDAVYWGNRGRMTDEPFTYRLIPPASFLDVYPTIIFSNETTALIGINPKRGFVLHSDGAKQNLKTWNN
ncbi:MAG: hypothetical protein LBG58_11635 [Planctomycetaceae bacterium]|jgi:hypothetical protein|nr:hypothetical protein [Planctomycetaceae bacterium]